MNQFQDGARFLSNFAKVEPEPASITAGMPVDVVYYDVTDSVNLPKFRPAS